MRLIDADKLKLEQTARIQLEEMQEYFALISYSKNQIDEAPTIEAIPVEWILHYVDTHYNVDNFDGIWRYIMKMHDEWEKENENI